MSWEEQGRGWLRWERMGMAPRVLQQLGEVGVTPNQLQT